MSYSFLEAFHIKFKRPALNNGSSIESGGAGLGGALSTAHDVIILKFIQTGVNLCKLV